MRSKTGQLDQSSSADLAAGSSSRSAAKLSPTDIAAAISQLRDRKGSTCTDIRNALLSIGELQPSFLQVKTAIQRGLREGTLRKVDRNRFILDDGQFHGKEAKTTPRSRGNRESFTALGRRRRRRRRGGRRRSKGRGKGRKRRRRRRRGRKGKGKGKKGRGRRGRRRRRRRRGKGKGKR